MNKEQFEQYKNKPEFEILRRTLIAVMNGNLMRLRHTSYMSDETRQVIQKLEAAGFRIEEFNNDSSREG